MRVVIQGGSGQIGGFLARHFRAAGHEVSVLGRTVVDPRLRWDGKHDGPWFEAIDGADVVLNLTGRSVKSVDSGPFRACAAADAALPFR